MKLNLAIASILAVAILAPGMGFAQPATQSTAPAVGKKVEPAGSQRTGIRHQGISYGATNDPKFVQGCKDARGTVGTQDRKTVCLTVADANSAMQQVTTTRQKADANSAPQTVSTTRLQTIFDANANDPKSVQACKDDRGSLGVQNEKPVCIIAK